MQSIDPTAKIYSAIGSEEPIFALVEAFYAGVEQDPILRPLYPEDLGPAKTHLALFLIQRLGGRGTYSEERGHPRMRARHLPFKIGRKERDAWMANMNNALHMIPALAPHIEVLENFFAEFATFMINQPE
jgi:hemoglobin